MLLQDVSPDPTKSCGPYEPITGSTIEAVSRYSTSVDTDHHDTIAMLAIDSHGDMAVGTTTNGASHKVPG